MTAEETWELAKKIFFLDKEGGFTSKEYDEIFPNMTKRQVFNLSPYEVSKKVKDYKALKDIKVGDIVEDKESVRYVVLDTGDTCNCGRLLTLFSENGCVEQIRDSLLIKVGKTAYIDNLLRILQRNPFQTN